jgi:hypothetical protein
MHRLDGYLRRASKGDAMECGGEFAIEDCFFS